MARALTPALPVVWYKSSVTLGVPGTPTVKALGRLVSGAGSTTVASPAAQS